MNQILSTSVARFFSFTFLVVAGLFAASPARAVNYSWTNTVSDSSGYWTNGVMWGQLVGTYPSGGLSSDEAYLTNQFAGTYTNIFNSKLNFVVSNLAISNALGEVWLILTNGAASPTALTNTNVRLGNGGRLQVDNGGTFRINNVLTWLGTNGTIYLNSGGRLDTLGNISIGAGGGVTGLVTSASGPGNGGVWNINNVQLTVGSTSSGKNNLFTIADGVTLTNLARLVVGGSAGADFNTFIVTNGARLFMSEDQGQNIVLIGATSSSSAGGGNNTVIISNSVLRSGNNVAGAAPIQVGWGSSNNTFTLLNSVWDGNWTNANQGQYNGIAVGGNLNTSAGLVPRTYNNLMIVSDSIISNIGYVAVGYSRSSGAIIGISNRLEVINGSVLSNVVGLLVGGGVSSAGSGYNSLIVTGANSAGVGSGLFMTQPGLISVGGNPGSGNNTVILSNSVLWGTIAAIGSGFGGGSSNNTLTIFGSSSWNGGGGALNIGAVAGSQSNSVTLDSVTATNFVSVIIGGGAGADGNSLILTNDSHFSMIAGQFRVGAGNSAVGGGGNTVILSNSLLTSTAASYIGFGSSNNTLRLLANTQWNLGGFTLTIGSATAAGNLTLVNGAMITNISTLTVGTAATSLQNSFLIENGGLLQANTLTIGGGTGNTISNVNSTFQFNQAAAVNSLTPGDIAITDGTISFRATGAGNVSTNAANQVNRIRFAGANTFRLDNASNTAATVSQTYTFDTVAGNPSNYVKLVMVNGATAYGNVNGANITIGSGGAFLASNTVATIAGTFTGDGIVDVVDATVNFQSVLQVAGTLSLQNGFLSGTAAKTVSGTLRGNGSVSGDVTVAGVIAPGFSLGTLVFSNDLTLTGSYQAEFGNAGSDQLVVVGELTLSGATLELTAAGAATGDAFVIATYGSLAGDGMFSTTTGLPSGYEIDYSYNGNQIAIVVVPEPSSIALVIGGLALLLVVRARRFRR